MIKITLLGRPLSTNHIYATRGKIKYLRKPARELREYYIRHVNEQYRGQPITRPVSLMVHIYWFGKEPDIDNVHKLSLDAMNGLVRLDDSQIVEMKIIKMEKDNQDPRLVFFIQ